MSSDLGRAIFVLAVVMFLGWFAVGTQLNIRTGHRLLRWLQDGMPRLGGRTTLRWLGSSAVELKVQTAVEPLRSAEVFIVLEPRDVPLLWWWFRARGRHDLLIVRGQLHAPPRFELEVLDPHAWSTRGVEGGLRRNRWSPVAVPSPSRLLAYGRGQLEVAPELIALATLPGLSLVRLAVHHSVPQLEVQWKIAGLERLESRRVLEAFYQVARRA
jgi:hypothetical protein